LARREEVIAAINEKVLGVWTPAHDDKGHHYLNTRTGVVEDSVTTKNIIEKPQLIPWAIRLAIEYLEKPGNIELLQSSERETVIKAATLQHRDVRDDAGSVGTEAHNAIERYVKEWIKSGVRPPTIKDFLHVGADIRSIAAARSAEKVFDENPVVPVATEFVVGKEGEGAGTLDLLVLTDKGKLELWDWKTSNSVNDFYACQAGAYTRFFEYMTGLRVTRVKVFKLNKTNNTFKVYIVKEARKAYQMYKHLSKVYDWLHAPNPKLTEDKKIIKL